MNLEIYPVVLDLVRQLGPLLPVLKPRCTELGDQFERALTSSLSTSARARIRTGRIGTRGTKRQRARRGRRWRAWRRRSRWGGWGRLMRTCQGCLDG
jgi:hypothetical protein